MPTAEPLRVAVVGAGVMGAKHCRLLGELDGVELAGVVDVRPDAAEALAGAHGAPVLRGLDEVAEVASAAVVAVPTRDHAEVGCRLLGLGLDVLIEKPIASSLAEADALVAAAGDRLLAVGHVEHFNPAVAALRAALPSPAGFVEVHRLASFTPRSLDIDVVLDLMIHDLELLHWLDPSPVAEIRANGVNVLSPQADIANARVELASGCVANLTASRVSAERLRKLRVFAPPAYFSLDYIEQEVHGVTLDGSGGERGFRALTLPVERGEPLARELAAFAAACRGEPAELVDGALGRRALATALAVAAAMGGHTAAAFDRRETA